jgi:poly-gamma-glutamate synthesis protein (capsule biosynthesis protein)
MKKTVIALKIIDRNGIKIGFLSYTYGTNGIPVPNDKPYLVSLIDKENE